MTPRNQKTPAGQGGGSENSDHVIKLQPGKHTATGASAQRNPALDGPPPRWRAGSTGETAEAGAAHIAPKTPTLRIRCLDHIEAEPSTPEQVFAKLTAEGVRTVLTSVRPRMTELAEMGLIVDSGRRGLGESGVCKSIIWRATTEAERHHFAACKAAEAEKAGE